MNLTRTLQNAPATLSEAYYEDGVLVDPGSVTVAITRADGTALTSGSASGSGAAARTFSLTAANLATLDLLTVTWTSATKGTRKSYVDVAGAYLFALADLDGLLQTPGNFTAAQKIAARIWVEQRIEGAIGRAFVPRYAYETLDGPRSGLLYTKGNPLRVLRSIETRSITTWTALTLTSYDVTYSGISGCFPRGHRNVRVGYEYGEDYPPPHVAEAAALWAKTRLVQGPVDDRELQRFIADTGAIVNLSTPGRGVVSGIPDVDSVIEAERIPALA